MFAPLWIAALLAAQPVPTTTPVEALQTLHFNAAQADEALLHRVVDLTGVPTVIFRDGSGGYIVRFDAILLEPAFSGRIEIHCQFPGTARGDLARIARGQAVTIRGIPHRPQNRLHALIDPNVRLEMKDCVISVISSPSPGAEMQ